MNGGQACVEVLRSAGVECVFGLLGGSMLEFYDALSQQDDIRYIGARDERAAGHMADAYARLRNCPGVVLGAQAGPGVVNLVTAVAEAHLAYSPLAAIAGAVTRADQGNDTFQEVDQLSLFAPICKRSTMVTDRARLAAALEQAMHLAMSGRRGPVVLHVPRDLFSEQGPAPQPRNWQQARPGQPAPAEMVRIVAALQAARRPIIFAGGGFKPDGLDELQALAEHLDLPVVCSTGHADLLTSDHPNNAGQTGARGNSLAADLTRNADLILALGARLGFNSTFLNHEYVNSDADIIQVDVEASAVGRYYAVAVGVQAGAAQTSAALRASLSDGADTGDWDKWRSRFRDGVKQLRAERDAEAKLDASPLHPQRVLAEMREVATPDVLYTIDTGNACLQAADRLTYQALPGLVAPLDFGLVGFGYAAALGAAAAVPDRPVVCVMGDGGFGYTMAELTTAVRYKMPVIAVVLDNAAWGAEKAYQQTYFNGRTLGADISTPPLDEFARLCGADGYVVREPGEMAAAYGAALEKRTSAVIHVHVDPQAIRPLRKDLFQSTERSSSKST